jgi:hypothetical protein
MNFHGLSFTIPRRMITISSGGKGVIAAKKDPIHPYFLSSRFNGNIFYFILLLKSLLPW